jgi:hypothetical protein
MKKLVSVGNISGEGRKWMAFREWLEVLRGGEQSPAGVYPITHLLLPNKYPQATIIFWDEKLDQGVKRSVQPPEWNAILAACEATPGRAFKGKALWLEIGEEGEVNILLDESPQAVYIPTSYGWEMA